MAGCTWDKANTSNWGDNMAINLTHRPDLEIRIEVLAEQLKLKGRGRKSATIERALDALEEKLEAERPSQEYIRTSLDDFSEGGDRLREQIYLQQPKFRGKPLSMALQDEIYDEYGLPK